MRLNSPPLHPLPRDNGRDPLPPVESGDGPTLLELTERTLLDAQTERRRSGGILMLTVLILFIAMAVGVLNLILIFARP